MIKKDHTLDSAINLMIESSPEEINVLEKIIEDRRLETAINIMSSIIKRCQGEPELQNSYFNAF